MGPIPSILPLTIPFSLRVSPATLVHRSVTIYLLCGRSVTLVDTGVAGSENLIYAALERAGRHPDEIRLIVLTHAHPDHMGAASAIREETGCQVAAHAGDRPWITDLEWQHRARPVPDFFSIAGSPVPVDVVLMGGEVLGEGNESLCVIHTPGHSQGSISLFHAASGTLFTGDAIPLPGHLPVYDDPAATARSLLSLQALPGITRICSAWAGCGAGIDPAPILSAGLSRIREVHDAVRASLKPESRADLRAVTAEVATRIGLPGESGNPLLLRTVVGHYAIRDRPDITVA